jgi:release factor glutamine methyltransferase
LFLYLVTFETMINKISSRDLLRHLTMSLAALYNEPESRSMAFGLIESRLGLRNTEVLADKALPTGHESELEQISKDLERLLAGEPLQYVLGEAEFWGLTLQVNKHVLIPRPETEELVALILKEKASLSQGRILDICTGSGCIAIALRHELRNASVWALDVSPEALHTARANAVRHTPGIQFIEADILSADTGSLPGMLDVIVSNPPYVTEAEKAMMKDNVLLHEPHLALFVSNHTPLVFYVAIARLGQKLLKSGGSIYFEINEQFGAETSALLMDSGYIRVELHKDLSGKNRMVRAIWPG